MNEPAYKVKILIDAQLKKKNNDDFNIYKNINF